MIKRLLGLGLAGLAAGTTWSGLAPGCQARRSELTLEARRRAQGLSLRETARLKLHHGPDRFINPFTEADYGNMPRVLYWKLFDRNHFKDYYPQEKVRPVSVDFNFLKAWKGLSVTYLKHASILIKDKGLHILIDPILDGLFNLKDFSPLEFQPSALPRPDLILITHGHYDHLDRPSLSTLGPGLHVVSPLGYNQALEGLAAKRTKLDWFDVLERDGLKITLLPCDHWTMRNPITGPNDSLWGSYLLQTATGPTIYVSGDTAFFPGFEEIGREFDIDLAVFNLGAYEPRWLMAQSHMNPAEVVQAFRQIRARRLMIAHWGTFRLGDEPVHFPPRDLKTWLSAEGLAERWLDLDHGQSAFYDGGEFQAAV
ncbi:MAG: MBL fold metallo-hydrolase [Thermodesulfobacteriota bacterium]